MFSSLFIDNSCDNNCFFSLCVCYNFFNLYNTSFFLMFNKCFFNNNWLSWEFFNNNSFNNLSYFWIHLFFLNWFINWLFFFLNNSFFSYFSCFSCCSYLSNYTWYNSRLFCSMFLFNNYNISNLSCWFFDFHSIFNNLFMFTSRNLFNTFIRNFTHCWNFFFNTSNNFSYWLFFNFLGDICCFNNCFSTFTNFSTCFCLFEIFHCTFFNIFCFLNIITFNISF